MTEVPKRLQPTNDTVRELYLKSGNECAFPGCDRRIIDAEGVVVGELCHIEAALPGGERFNEKQTNDERRSFGNLMLMCHDHHKVTDDVDTYPVGRLRKMKAEHESKYTNVIEKIRDSVIDYTAVKEVHVPSKFERFFSVLGWEFSQDEIEQTTPEIIDILQRVRQLPEPTRDLLTIMILRGEEKRSGDVSVLFPDVAKATRTSPKDLYDHVRIMERYKVAKMYDDDNTMIHLAELPQGGSYWGDFKRFAERIGVPLQEILVNLRFELFE